MITRRFMWQACPSKRPTTDFGDQSLPTHIRDFSLIFFLKSFSLLAVTVKSCVASWKQHTILPPLNWWSAVQCWVWKGSFFSRLMCSNYLLPAFHATHHSISDYIRARIKRMGEWGSLSSLLLVSERMGSTDCYRSSERYRARTITKEIKEKKNYVLNLQGGVNIY